jgi:hypothetical protein
MELYTTKKRLNARAGWPYMLTTQVVQGPSNYARAPPPPCVKEGVNVYNLRSEKQFHESELWEQQSGKLVFSPLKVCQQITVTLN